MTNEEIVQAVADSITEFVKQFPARVCLDGSIGWGATPMDVAKKAVEKARPLIEAPLREALKTWPGIVSRQALEAIPVGHFGPHESLDEDMSENDGELLARLGTDGMLWAKEYCKRFGGDVGGMLGWFCNAIEAGRDAGMRSAEAERDRLAKENDNLRSTLYQLDTEAYPEWESLYAAEMQALVHQVDERDRLREALVAARTELARWRWGNFHYGQVTDCLAVIDEALGSEA